MCNIFAITIPGKPIDNWQWAVAIGKGCRFSGIPGTRELLFVYCLLSIAW